MSLERETLARCLDFLNVAVFPVVAILFATLELTVVSITGYQSHDQEGRQQNERSHQDAERYLSHTFIIKLIQI